MALALGQVFESAKGDVTFYRGSLNGSPNAISRIRARAGLEERTTATVGYVDRQGRIHLPFVEALDLGRKFCAAEPATVLVARWGTRARNVVRSPRIREVAVAKPLSAH